MARKDAKALERKLGKWPGGVDQVSDIKGLQAREVPALREAENVDIRTDGRVHRRTGQTLVREGSCHSGWAPLDESMSLFVAAGVLYRMKLVGGVEVIETLGSVGGDSALYFAEQAGLIYGSNARARFAVGRTGPMLPWGVEAPSGQPLLSAIADRGLFGGTYQVAVTFIAATGEESGTKAAAVVTIEAGQGVLVSQIPQPSSGFVALIRLYATHANGEILRAAIDLVPGTTEVELSQDAIQQGGKELQTQHHERVPYSSHVQGHKGRIFFVPRDSDQKRVCYTQALLYGLHKPHEHYLPVPEPITGIIALTQGIYVGTESAVYWFEGAEPSAMNRQLVQRYGMVKGTGKSIRGTVFGGELAQGEVAVWWNSKGELIRAAGALNLNVITRSRISLPNYTAGALVARERNGVSQIVSSLQGPKHDSGFATQDRAEAQIFRHGVAIN